MATKTVRVILEALTSSYQAKMAQSTASTRAFGAQALQTAQQHQAAFQTMGLAATAFGIGLGVALKYAADAAINFESSFAGIRKTVDATEAEFEVLAQGMRDLSKTIPVNVNELNRIGEAAGQLGVAKEGILEFTKTVAQLGASTTLSTDAAAEGLARIANIMGTSEGDFDKLGSAIVALGNAGASSEPEIVDFALRIAGAGQIAGLAESDILAIANAMSSVGVASERGGTAVQRALLAMLTAVNQGGEQLEKFAEVSGMSAERFASVWRSDPSSAFLAFVQGLHDSGQQASVILGDLGLGSQLTLGAFLALAGGVGELSSSLDVGATSWESNTALQEEAAKRFETTASKVEIAKNQINDAAISFGQLLLPAIAAVLGGIGDLADFFGDLPGPVKAVAVAVAVLATGLALLLGASLLAQSAMLRLGTAMTQAGIQGGRLGGALKLAAGAAFNPWTIAIGAATIGLTYLAQKNADAKARVQELTTAIEADSGALDTNTRAAVANRLEKQGILADAQAIGIGLDTLTDAALGEADAQAEVATAIEAVAGAAAGLPTGLARGKGALDESGAAALRVQDALGGLDSDLAAAQAAYQRIAAAASDAGGSAGGAATFFREASDAAKSAGEGAEGAVPPVVDLGDSMDEAATLGERLAEVLAILAGTELAVSEANLAWLDSLAQMNDELTHQTDAEGNLTNALIKGVKTLDLHTEGGRAALQVINDQIAKAKAHGQAVADETGSLNKGVRATAQHIEAIKREAIQAGISKKAINEYIDQLNLTPKDIRTLIELRGAKEAEAQLRNVLSAAEALDERSVDIYVRTHRVEHEGGPVFHEGGQILHGGGQPRLRGDEVAATLQRGEFVVRKSAVQRVGVPFLHEINRMHAGGMAGGDPGRVIERVMQREFSKLSDAMTEAADLIESAIEDGLSKANVKSAREISKLIAERQRDFEKMLSEARDRLAKVQERMTAFSESIASGFATGSDLISGLIDLQSELTEEGGPGFSGADMQTFLAEQVAQSQDFASALRALQAAGLDPALLADLASKGPEALPFIQALLESGPQIIAEFNAAATAIADIAHATSEDLATEEFGKALDKARDALGALGERIDNVMARLEARLVKFIEGIRADTTAKKFDELNRSLDRLLRMFDGSATGVPGFASGGVHRGGLAITGERGPELAAWPAGTEFTSLGVLASARPASAATRPVVAEGPSGPLEVSGTLLTPWGPAQVRGIAREQGGAQRAFDERIERASR